jgi:hypothetical protein
MNVAAFSAVERFLFFLVRGFIWVRQIVLEHIVESTKVSAQEQER